jgi:predicted ribosome quality control (RQC) complex YloA/Tae2 family protein
MLSLRELERAAAILRREIVGHRIQHAVQTDATTVVLELFGDGASFAQRAEGERSPSGGRSWLTLSCDAEQARVGERREAPDAGGSAPPRFAQYLRAHLRGARVRDVEMVDGERQLALRASGAEGDSTLLLAIFGRKSNLVVLDAEGRIALTLRPLAETRPELAQGGPWQPPGRTLPRAGEDRFAALPDADYLAAIEAHYAERVRATGEDDLHRRVEGALRKEAKSLERKLEKVARELAGAEVAAQLERQGELLKSAQGRVRRGDREVVVRDWDSGADVRIELDPKLGPGENLERIFARYRKGVRALTAAGAQQATVAAARDALAALERELAAVADGAALEAFANRSEVARLMKKYAPPPAPTARPEAAEVKIAGRALPAKFVPRRYRTADDLEIWVGRSDDANDYLTTKLARGKDLFFHVAATPGSHVILRTGGRADPPSDAILDACELAAHYSKAKNATRVDVHVVPIANVRKPKGAKSGLVEVHGGKNVHLRREEARLRRVLDARIEE